ncbi:MAG: hypothetical protein NT039_04640 [Candidatus Berkelbacteria bacterium]|nr:hypothetical protein [Candidatus Berkelbacteria bacterium]
MATLNRVTLTNKIYSKRCPECGKDNLESSAFCWNCNHEFPDTVAEAAHEGGHWWSNFFVTLVLIGALVVFILIILDAIHK